MSQNNYCRKSISGINEVVELRTDVEDVKTEVDDIQASGHFNDSVFTTTANVILSGSNAELQLPLRNNPTLKYPFTTTCGWLASSGAQTLTWSYDTGGAWGSILRLPAGASGSVTFFRDVEVNNLIAADAIRPDDGTAAVPAHSFSKKTDTGSYYSTGLNGTELSFATDGVRRVFFDSTGFQTAFRGQILHDLTVYNQPTMVRRKTATQTVTNGGSTIVLWETSLKDIGVGSKVVYDSGVFTIGQGGRYLVTYSLPLDVTIAPSDGSVFLAYIQYDGFRYAQTRSFFDSTIGANVAELCGSAVFDFSETEEFYIGMYQLTGATRDFRLNAGEQGAISIIKIC